jgi:hypothetical protein
MTHTQANILHFVAVSATVVLLTLVVTIELNPEFSRGRRVLLALDMAALGLIIVLDAITHR